MPRGGEQPAPRRGVSGGDTGSVPADWREYDGRAPRRRGQAEALDHLLGQVKTVHQHCVCHGESAARCGPGGSAGPQGSGGHLLRHKELGWHGGMG